MAIDLKSLDKKKLFIGVFAVGAAFMATVLTNTYINQTIAQQAKLNAVSKDEVENIKKGMEVLNNNDRSFADNLAVVQKLAMDAQRQTAAGGTGKVSSQQTSLSSRTPTGRRAVTALIDTLEAVGGMVAPGDFVDVICHISVPTDPKNPRNAELVSATLFQNVQVLAVEGETAPGKISETQRRAKTLDITLALDPQEAGLIAFAQKQGKLQLVLRSHLDTQAYMIPATTWRSFSDYLVATQGVDLGVSPKKETPQEDIVSAPMSDREVEVYKEGKYEGLQ